MRRSLLLAAAAGDPSDALGRSRCACRDRALRRALERRAARARCRMRSAAIWPGRPARTCRAPRPSCASWRRRRRIRSSPGGCSARRCSAAAARRRVTTAAGPRRGLRRLLVLALACQASISIVQWGLGVIAPGSAAPLRPLRGEPRRARQRDGARQRRRADRRGRRRRSLRPAAAAAVRGLGVRARCSSTGALARRIPSGSASRSSRAASRARSWRSARPSRCSTASRPSGAASRSGMRQMSVALGGLLAALLLPLAVHVGGVRLALGVSGRADGRHGGRRSRSTLPHGPIVAADAPAARRRAVRGAAGARHAHALLVVGVLYICALDAVLTFAVPALRDGGAEPRRGQPAVRVRAASARWSRASAGAASPTRAAAAGGSATLRDVGILACGAALADLGRVAARHGRPDRARSIVLSLGALGFNGVLYLIAGEIAGAARAGQAVALMSTGALRRRRAGARCRSAPSPTPRATAASGWRRPLASGARRARDPRPRAACPARRLPG